MYFWCSWKKALDIGAKSLYILIFLALLSASGHWQDPKTIAFVMSIVMFAFTGIRLAMADTQLWNNNKKFPV